MSAQCGVGKQFGRNNNIKITRKSHITYEFQQINSNLKDLKIGSIKHDLLNPFSLSYLSGTPGSLCFPYFV